MLLFYESALVVAVLAGGMKEGFNRLGAKGTERQADGLSAGPALRNCVYEMMNEFGS